MHIFRKRDVWLAVVNVSFAYVYEYMEEKNMRRLAVGMIVIAFIFTSFYYQPAKSADCYVPTIFDPTISYAVADLNCTGTIYVAAGTYTALLETFPIEITRPLTLIGAGVSTNTTATGIPISTNTTSIIDGGGGSSPPSIFIVKGAEVTIQGFTIRGGSHGIRYESGSSGRIENNVITGNSGNGIYTIDGSNPTIAANTIMGNGGFGIQTQNSNPTITNNVIVHNSLGGIGTDSSGVIITNNTIVANIPHGVYVATGSPRITNNIIASNTQYGIYVVSGNPINRYNDLWKNTSGDYFGTSGGTGSLYTDPQFVSATDFHLQCSSPVIDAGDNFAPGIPLTDKDGNPRIIDKKVDMGAYEIRCTAKPPRKPPSMGPAARNRMSRVNIYLEQANALLLAAKAKGLDTSQCENLMEESDELLKEAKASLYNPIYANNLALKAMKKAQEATDCLKTLLGQAP